jgi:tetratricopeptide (TPR) repeat protein
MWSDSGVFAFFVFAMMWLVALRDVFALAQQRRGDMAAVAITAALTGAFVHGLVDFDLYVPGVAVPMFLLLGVVQGLKEVPNESSGAVPWAGGVACAILVGAVLWWESQGLAANFAYGRALELRAARPTLALAEAEEAARLAPRNAYYQSTAGDLAVEAGLFTRAIDHYKRAIENDPNRASYHWRLARAHLSAFGPDGVALTQARLAAMLNPTNPRYQRDAAEIEESLRQSESSLLESNPAKE